jgi:hypothetical protein
VGGEAFVAIEAASAMIFDKQTGALIETNSTDISERGKVT